jgi:hypothetical protein
LFDRLTLAPDKIGDAALDWKARDAASRSEIKEEGALHLKEQMKKGKGLRI